MKKAKAQSAPAPAHIKRLDAGYLSPEWGYTLDHLNGYALWGLTAALYVPGFVAAVWHDGLDLDFSQRLWLAGAGFAAAYMLAFYLNTLLRGFGGGYGLALVGQRRLRGEFAPGKFRLCVGGRWHVFNAGTPHQFTMREHRLRVAEGRAEERAKSYGASQIANHYRIAWQVILDIGSARFVLADVADEDQARALVRRLHDLDLHARGAGGAGSRSGEENAYPGAPTGKRPNLE
jgi:hypothetical protein